VKHMAERDNGNSDETAAFIRKGAGGAVRLKGEASSGSGKLVHEPCRDRMGLGHFGEFGNPKRRGRGVCGREEEREETSFQREGKKVEKEGGLGVGELSHRLGNKRDSFFRGKGGV